MLSSEQLAALSDEDFQEMGRRWMAENLQRREVLTEDDLWGLHMEHYNDPCQCIPKNVEGEHAGCPGCLADENCKLCQGSGNIPKLNGWEAWEKAIKEHGVEILQCKQFEEDKVFEFLAEKIASLGGQLLWKNTPFGDSARDFGGRDWALAVSLPKFLPTPAQFDICNTCRETSETSK